MYHPLWTLLGLAIVGAVAVDAAVTTLLPSGAGPVSGRVSRWVGRLAMRGSGTVSESACMLALLGAFLLWALLVLAGWTLVFCGAESAVLSSSDRSPAPFAARIYFAGFTTTTLGIGDYVPGGTAWRLLTVAAAANGFFLLTMCVTYVFSVLQALNERRALGVAVRQLGRTPSDVVSSAAAGGLLELSLQLQQFTTRLQQSVVKSDAYPVVEYTHASDDDYSFAVAVASLGEVALLFEFAVDPAHAPPPVVLTSLREAVNLLIREKRPRRGVAPPDPPRIEPLRERGVAVRDDWRDRLGDRQVVEQRERLAAWLAWHHRDWTTVTGAD